MTRTNMTYKLKSSERTQLKMKKINQRKKVKKKKLSLRKTPMMIQIQMIQVMTHQAMIHQVMKIVMRRSLRRRQKKRKIRRKRVQMMILTQALPIPALLALMMIKAKIQIQILNQKMNSSKELKSQRSMSSCFYQEKRWHQNKRDGSGLNMKIFQMI